MYQTYVKTLVERLMCYLEWHHTWAFQNVLIKWMLFSNGKCFYNYCPLVCTCHSRINNTKINRLHGRCLRVIYNDKTSSFENLLEKDGSVSIHNRNLQVLAIEMFKINRGIFIIHYEKYIWTKSGTYLLFAMYFSIFRTVNKFSSSWHRLYLS